MWFNTKENIATTEAMTPQIEMLQEEDGLR